MCLLGHPKVLQARDSKMRNKTSVILEDLSPGDLLSRVNYLPHTQADSCSGCLGMCVEATVTFVPNLSMLSKLV